MSTVLGIAQASSRCHLEIKGAVPVPLSRAALSLLDQFHGVMLGSLSSGWFSSPS